jgi:hypothetical protein
MWDYLKVQAVRTARTGLSSSYSIRALTPTLALAKRALNNCPRVFTAAALFAGKCEPLPERDCAMPNKTKRHEMMVLVSKVRQRQTQFLHDTEIVESPGRSDTL